MGSTVVKIYLINMFMYFIVGTKLHTCVFINGTGKDMVRIQTGLRAGSALIDSDPIL